VEDRKGSLLLSAGGRPGDTDETGVEQEKAVVTPHVIYAVR
jgi:hypothetical protein